MTVDLTDDERSRMTNLVSGRKNKSEKIRALGAAGFPRNKIAAFLGVRYQHVRNVLVNEAEKKARDAYRAPGGPRDHGVEDDIPRQVVVSIDAAGRLVVPAPYRRALGIGDGDDVLLRLDGDELRLLSRTVAVRKAQAIVRRSVPEGVSLVDELLAERRREAVAEGADG